MAQIQVEDSGQNSIVIVAGANDELSVEDVTGCRDLVAGARVFSCVLEIPRPTALAGLALATQLSGSSARGAFLFDRNATGM